MPTPTTLGHQRHWPHLPSCRRGCLRSYAFGYLLATKQPEAAALLLLNDVLPFCRKRNLPVTVILTDNRREFSELEMHPYEPYLALDDNDHRTTPVRSPQTNGSVKRFIHTVKEEFFEAVIQQKFFDPLTALQTGLASWLWHYMTERLHRGYCNMGDCRMTPRICFKKLLSEKVS